MQQSYLEGGPIVFTETSETRRLTVSTTGVVGSELVTSFSDDVLDLIQANAIPIQTASGAVRWVHFGADGTPYLSDISGPISS